MNDVNNITLKYVDSINKLGGKLLSVEKPARYVGGEVGCLARNNTELSNNELKTLIAFPDLYEIGMGNKAVRIIYNYMNNVQRIFCDRAFAPAPDFEKLLRENNIPLYGLDTGISLASLDLLMFTLGYELGLNGILTMLDVSGIPLRCNNRISGNKEYPIVIAGGPAVSNPLPYSPYVDVFWIGEAEAGFFDLAAELNQLKKNGKGREELLEKIKRHPNIWANGKENTVRAVFNGFSQSSDLIVYPVPSMKIAQHHGAVEIMRGCPNGCRFCHAGFWYRPARQKHANAIVSQVNDLVTKGGWQEISLSSLSSGDYGGIDQLIDTLNLQFSSKRVSFQLPSLKVSSFALSLLEKISVTRKSGLTFAVETPVDVWQMAVNKEVTRDSVVTIIDEAKKRGWRGAKFYFMLGLPKPENINEIDVLSEEEEIVSFITDIGRRTRMRFNINIGIFIPKPHTPYQCVSQIDTDTAEKKLIFIRSKLKPLGHKVSTSDPLITKIESVISRGDERAGFLCEEAWKNGSRLDPWNEYINKEKWSEILNNNIEYVNSIFSGKDNLPWSKISSCVTGEYLLKEFEKSNKSLRTVSCKEKCNLCGVCLKPSTLRKPENNENKTVNQSKSMVNDNLLTKSDPAIYRILFSFSKNGSSVFHGHLSLIEIFSMAFRRSNIPVMYTQGFNPLAKIEFASPLSIGIRASQEIGIANFTERYSPEEFIAGLNSNLPDGIRIVRAEIFLIKSGAKKHSLSSLLWGYGYSNKDGTDYISAQTEKIYRQNRLEKDCRSLFDFTRSEVLAKNVIGGINEWASYFDVYGYLYKEDK